MSDSPTTVFSSDESPKIGFVTRVYVWLMQPKIGIPLAIFVMCLAGPFIYRAMRLFQIPEPPMPFDVAAFKADIVPEEKNGARLLAEIDKRSPPFPPMENRTGHNEALENGRWEAASPKLQEWVLDHRDALDKWRELAHMPDMQVYKPGEADYFTTLPHAGDIGSFSQYLIVIEAGRLRSTGQTAAAGELLVDTLRVADHLSRHGCLAEYFVRDRIYRRVGDALLDWAVDPKVSTQELKKLIANAEPVLSQRMTIERHLMMDYLALRHVTDDWSWHDRFVLISPASRRTLTDKTLFRLQYFQGEPENCAKAAGYVFGRYLEEIPRPRHERSKLVHAHGFAVFEPSRGRAKSTLTATEIAAICARSQLYGAIVPAQESFITHNDLSLARIELLRVALALELYRREEGQYPERLEELAPQYIANIPDDDFSDVKAPLKYVRDGRSAKVWSVGSNGVDDGGNVIGSDVPNYLAAKETPDFGIPLGAAREALKP